MSTPSIITIVTIHFGFLSKLLMEPPELLRYLISITVSNFSHSTAKVGVLGDREWKRVAVSGHCCPVEFPSSNQAYKFPSSGKGVASTDPARIVRPFCKNGVKGVMEFGYISDTLRLNGTTWLCKPNTSRTNASTQMSGSNQSVETLS